METVHGAPSWRLESDRVRLFVSRDGGMVAPAVFCLGEREVSPYALAPWTPAEADDGLPVLLKNLRGDFFCLPFGPQEDGPPHGEPANAAWTLKERREDALVLAMECGDSGASVEKEVAARAGEAVIYHEFRISGLAGKWSYGNHPVLDASGMAEGAARLSVSPFRWGSVYQGVFSAPERQEAQALEESAVFGDLTAVPLAAGGTTDLTRYPARRGYEDLVMMVSEPATKERPFAWSALVLDGYVWFSLKDPADFPATLFWLSNGGRRDVPWEGRHLGRVGIEEVCSHFCDGVDVSREERLTGIPTVREFDAERTTTLRIVHAVAAVPPEFGRVVGILPAGDGRVSVRDEAGVEVATEVDWSHVRSENPISPNPS